MFLILKFLNGIQHANQLIFIVFRDPTFRAFYWRRNFARLLTLSCCSDIFVIIFFKILLSILDSVLDLLKAISYLILIFFSKVALESRQISVYFNLVSHTLMRFNDILLNNFALFLHLFIYFHYFTVYPGIFSIDLCNVIFQVIDKTICSWFFFLVFNRWITS